MACGAVAYLTWTICVGEGDAGRAVGGGGRRRRWARGVGMAGYVVGFGDRVCEGDPTAGNDLGPAAFNGWAGEDI